MKTLIAIFAAAALTFSACKESTVNPPNTNNNTNARTSAIQLLTSTEWTYSASTGDKPEMKSMTFTSSGTFTSKSFTNTAASGTYSVSDNGKTLTTNLTGGKTETATIVELTATKFQIKAMIDNVETTITFIPAMAQIVGWEQATTGLGSIFVYDFAVTETVVYAGTQNGVFRSTNDGETWNDISLMANANYRFTESVDARTSDYVAYLCWDGGKNQKIMFTTNGGTTWTDAMLTFPITNHLTSIAIGPTYWAIGSTSGVYVVDTASFMDNCRLNQETSIGTPIPGSNVTVVKIMPSNPANGIIASTIDGLILTTDRGITWQKIGSLRINSMAATTTAIAGVNNDVATLYDITGNVLMTNTVQDAIYRGVCFTPDGRLVVGGFKDISTLAKDATTWATAAEGLPTTGFAISTLDANSRYIFLGRDSNGDCVYRRKVTDF